jgi:hypothetical protein
MIQVKEAAEKAREHLLSFFPDAEKVQLEEVELTPDKGHWFSSLLVGKSVRYKIFKLDAESGEVLSMKIRDIK